MSTALARKFRVQVTTDLTLAGGFTTVFGLNDFNPDVTPNLEDSSDYESNGVGSSEPTMIDGTITMTFNRKTVAGVLDPGQEIMRACVGQFGDAARCGVRWFDKTGGPETGQGIIIPQWKRAGTGVKNLDSATVTGTITDGVLNLNITNPGTAAVDPVVISAAPTAVAAAGVVKIIGTGFTGTVVTTGVKFGGVNATSWIVVSDNVIVAVMPAGSAGAAAVVVTNAVGASNSLAYTRA